MPREFSRTDRVADFLRQELAQLIRFEVKDPRLGMVNITDVEVSKDMSYAKVYFTLVGSPTDLKANADEGKRAEGVLNRASGFLRHQVAANSTMRTTPQLQFVHDTSVVAGGQLSALIDKVVAKDKAHHRDE